jgi:hypothetical protein
VRRVGKDALAVLKEFGGLLFDLLVFVGEWTLHILSVAVGLLIAPREDRTAATFLLAGSIFVAADTWVGVGILIALYGCLLFIKQGLEAFLAHPRR